MSGRGEPGRELVGDRVDRHEVHRRILLRTYARGDDGDGTANSLGTLHSRDARPVAWR